MKRSAALILAVVVLITVLIWAGVHNARQRRLAVQNAAATQMKMIPGKAGADGEAQMADAGPGEAESNLRGKPAPAFTLTSLDGKKVSLADFKGHPVLVNFWATWCAPCKLEMPWFEEFNAKYAPQGLVILGVSMDDIGKDEIAKTVKKTGVTYPILLKDDKIGTNYGGVDYLPMSYYVNGAGVIVEQTAGLGGKDMIEANIKKLLAAGAK